MFGELKSALRALFSAKSFSLGVIVLIAFSVGCNTAIFGIVNTVLWKPLSFEKSAELFDIAERTTKASKAGGRFSAPDYLFLASHSRSFESLGAYAQKEWELSGVDHPARVNGSRVTASLFATLRAKPQIGRFFSAQEDRNGARLAVLSDLCWRGKFAGDATIVGRKIYLDREPYTVIGVLPPALVFPVRHAGINGVPADVYVPMSWMPIERQFGYMINKGVLGRLRPGVTPQQATLETDAILKSAEEQYPSNFRAEPGFGLSADIRLYQELVSDNLDATMLVLLSAVGAMLLIACANVTNLLFARSLHRRREFALRSALGASRWAIVRQGLVESVLLSSVAACLGLLLAAFLGPYLVRFAPVELPRTDEIGLDWRGVLFAVTGCCLIPLFFGAAPALEASRIELAKVLGEAGRSRTQSKRQKQWMATAVVLQYALVVLLVSTAGLLLRSFLQLRKTNPGFEQQQVLTVGLKLPTNSYQTREQIASFFDHVIESVRALPGTLQVGAISDLPMKPSDHWGLAVEGKGPETSAPRSVALSWVRADALDAMKVRLQKGRLLKSSDGPSSPRVVVINEALARQAWPGEDPIGKRLGLGGTPSDSSGWVSVVGVIADIRQELNENRVEPQAFESQDQASAGASALALRSMYLVVRTNASTPGAIAVVRSIVQRRDPALPVSEIQTLEQHVSSSIHSQRFDVYLVGAFGIFALLLAAVGLGGILSYKVGQRTGEIGIRIALGGNARDIVRLVLREGLNLAALGVVIGVTGALLAGKLLAGLLYETSSFDLKTFVVVPTAVLLTAIISALVPAWRASRIDPVAAIRME